MDISRKRRSSGISITGFVVLGLFTAACGGSGSESTVEPIADGTLVVVGDDTQAFDAETYQIAAGEVTFEYRLDGFQEHSLVIEGREDEMRLVVENGETDRGTITLEPGRYILYCDIAGHRIGGMEARLLVG
jgi:plastocyanin